MIGRARAALQARLAALSTFLGQCRHPWHGCPTTATTLELLRFYPAWSRSLGAGRTALADRLPWITLPALELLRGKVSRATRVFEFGAGGSTLYFADHAREVVSVEHDPAWAEKVRAGLRGDGNARVTVVPPVPVPGLVSQDYTDPRRYASTAFPGASMEAYARAIDAYPDGHFDVILVDGRARPSCFMHAVPKLARGGLIIVDNTERLYYWDSLNEFSRGLAMHDFPGPGPYAHAFTRTTAWERPA
jgi:hypothetical protein